MRSYKESRLIWLEEGILTVTSNVTGQDDYWRQYSLYYTMRGDYEDENAVNFRRYLAFH